MNKLALLLCVFLISTVSFASSQTQWQMLTTSEKNAAKPAPKAKPAPTAKKPAPRMQARPVYKLSKLAPLPRAYTPRTRPVTVTMLPGSIRANIIRIAKQNGWRTVVWNAANDYSWVGKTTVTAPHLEGIFSKILADYPLQANFYDGNHVLAIDSRTLQ